MLTHLKEIGAFIAEHPGSTQAVSFSEIIDNPDEREHTMTGPKTSDTQSDYLASGMVFILLGLTFATLIGTFVYIGFSTASDSHAVVDGGVKPGISRSN